MISVAEAAAEAAQLLRDHGWTSGTMENRRGERCLAGAVHWSVNYNYEADEVFSAAYEVISEQFPGEIDFAGLSCPTHEGCVIAWNDRYGTCERALLVLDKLAKRETISG